MLKKVAIIGGGPSGLYAAYLLKKRQVAEVVDVYELNPRLATYGFGISMADSGLRRLSEFDPDSYEIIRSNMHTLQSHVLELPDGAVTVRDSRNAGAIGRANLLEILTTCCEQSGVKLHHEHSIDSLDSFLDCDLVLGADGTNSIVRNSLAADFGTSTYYLGNRFAWFGTHCPYEGSTLTFLAGKYGNWCGHHYRYTDTMSTFVPECDAETWKSLELGAMTDTGRREFIQDAFAETLNGFDLIENNSVWRCFRVTANKHIVHQNVALLGDALFTAHFSIGSGTRLAMEDSIALVQSLEKHPESVESALEHYQDHRGPERHRLVDACEKSWMWFEDFGQQVKDLSPLEFSYEYMTRTGRLNDEKLRGMSPEFMAKLDEHRRLVAGNAGSQK